jgi:hypothetical protein
VEPKEEEGEEEVTGGVRKEVGQKLFHCYPNIYL